MKQLAATIRGRVQGVYFRTTTRDQARRLGLSGWVRNCHDGSVELLARGTEAALGQLLSWCRQGPPGARVDSIEHHFLDGDEWGDHPGSGFEVRY